MIKTGRDEKQITNYGKKPEITTIKKPPNRDWTVFENQITIRKDRYWPLELKKQFL